VQGEPAPGTAAEFIVRAASQHPGQVVVLALAALTNVALALHLDPRLPEKLVRSWRGLCAHVPCA
jgi:inosine-uridine nucleoside N-ribohydrolase